MNYKRSWYPSFHIQPKHQSLPVTQIYIWLNSQDGKIAIVSKDGDQWQFPGGKPAIGEDYITTIVREVSEETSLVLNTNISAKLFGYYVVEESDSNDQIVRTFLQLRFVIKLDQKSSSLQIHPHEKDTEAETEKIIFAKWVTIVQAKRMIPWLSKSPELEDFTQVCFGI